jgi:hypothetical protein
MDNHQSFRATGHAPRATNRIYRSTVTEKNESSSKAEKSENLRNFRDLKVWQTAKEIAAYL